MSPLRYGGDIALRREFIRILATIKRREAQQACDACAPGSGLPSLDTASEPPSPHPRRIDPPPLPEEAQNERPGIGLS